ncbi:MAG: hypothetical protein L6V85_04535 [Clostridiales bacterium]|nr:MAG: hypothetical protein L6V85_04535 [Clostridiales bacterium]
MLRSAGSIITTSGKTRSSAKKPTAKRKATGYITESIGSTDDSDKNKRGRNKRRNVFRRPFFSSSAIFRLITVGSPLSATADANKNIKTQRHLIYADNVRAELPRHENFEQKNAKSLVATENAVTTATDLKNTFSYSS